MQVKLNLLRCHDKLGTWPWAIRHVAFDQWTVATQLVTGPTLTLDAAMRLAHQSMRPKRPWKPDGFVHCSWPSCQIKQYIDMNVTHFLNNSATKVDQSLKNSYA